MPYSNITKKALAAAMKELMAERPFVKINVGDICERCGMNRKSFYYHFQDKYELVNWIFYHEFIIPHRGSDYEVGWHLLQDLGNYLYENKAFYKNALSVDGQNSFREYFGEIFTPIASEYLRDIIPRNGYEELTTKYFVDATLIATVSWLNARQDIPADIFISLVKGTLLGFSKHIVASQEANERSDDAAPDDKEE